MISLVLLIITLSCSTTSLPAEPGHLLYPAPIHGKYGFLDSNGRVVIEPRFDHVRLFSEGMAVVEVGEKYGFIDSEGTQIVPPKYENALSFSEGLAAVQIGQKWGYIDMSGRYVIEPRFGSQLGGAGSFSEGLAPVLFNSKMGYIDRSGRFVIEPRFEFAEEFSEGLAVVGMVPNEDRQRNDKRPKFGYIDKTGRIVVALAYAGAHTFHEGLAVVAIYRIGVKFYPQAVIDHSGAQVVGPVDAGIGDFHEGLARFSPYAGEGSGFVNKTGKQIISPRFHDFDDKGPTDFSEGLAAVSLSNGQSGYINRTGRMVISARFDIACPFRGGMALVFKSDRVGYISTTGKYVWSEPAGSMPDDEEPGCFW